MCSSDLTSKLAYVELHERQTKAIATDFLRNLIETIPYRIHTILTDNGIQFTRVWTQLIHSLMAKMWIMARKLRLSFSKRVASLRMSFMVQKKRSMMLRIL